MGSCRVMFIEMSSAQPGGEGPEAGSCLSLGFPETCIWELGARRWH